MLQFQFPKLVKNVKTDHIKNFNFVLASMFQKENLDCVFKRGKQLKSANMSRWVISSLSIKLWNLVFVNRLKFFDSDNNHFLEQGGKGGLNAKREEFCTTHFSNECRSRNQLMKLEVPF